MTFADPSGRMISSLQSFRAARKLKSSAGMSRYTEHFELCLIPTSRYGSPLSAFGNSTAKSTDQVLNSPLIGIRLCNSSLLPGLVFWRISELRTKFEASERRSGHRNMLATDSQVDLKS